MIAAAYPATVGDSCGQFFGMCLRAANPPVPDTARVLEIGCSEYPWLVQAVKSWPAMTFTGIDWRAAFAPPSATVIKGDVLTHAFPPESFDWINSISAIEHIGLGHYSRDPLDSDGDSKTIARCWDWLAPGGWLSFDVPYNPGKYEVVGTSHRIYDDAAIESRLKTKPWVEHWRGIAANGDTHHLLTNVPQLKGGESFYYIGFWWQKPGA